MATDESFLAASDPNGQTLTWRHNTSAATTATAELKNGGCIGGCIPGVAVAIGGLAENEQTPVPHCETGVFIVQDSSGNYYLMGDEGLEPPTFSV